MHFRNDAQVPFFLAGEVNDCCTYYMKLDEIHERGSKVVKLLELEAEELVSHCNIDETLLNSLYCIHM